MLDHYSFLMPLPNIPQPIRCEMRGRPRQAVISNFSTIFHQRTNEWEDMCCVQRNIQHANSIISDKKQPRDCIDELGYLQPLTA
jgi:hypothetical protein